MLTVFDRMTAMNNKNTFLVRAGWKQYDTYIINEPINVMDAWAVATDTGIKSIRTIKCKNVVFQWYFWIVNRTCSSWN